jgi:hypothetical protein
VSSTKNVTVNVQQTLTSVTVSPATASIRVNRTVQFRAKALDQFGNTIQASFAWTIFSGPGKISSNGLYTGTTAGTAVIQAKTTWNGVTMTSTATVTVTKH